MPAQHSCAAPVIACAKPKLLGAADETLKVRSPCLCLLTRLASATPVWMSWALSLLCLFNWAVSSAWSTRPSVLYPLYPSFSRQTSAGQASFLPSLAQCPWWCLPPSIPIHLCPLCAHRVLSLRCCLCIMSLDREAHGRPHAVCGGGIRRRGLERGSIRSPGWQPSHLHLSDDLGPNLPHFSWGQC